MPLFIAGHRTGHQQAVSIISVAFLYLCQPFFGWLYTFSQKKTNKNLKLLKVMCFWRFFIAIIPKKIEQKIARFLYMVPVGSQKL
jgi:hypothetical protein